MGAKSSRSFPHQALWRKLRRRYFVDGQTILYCLFVLPPVICSLAWLCNGPVSLLLTVAFGFLWFVSCTLTFLALSLSLIFRRRQNKAVPPLRFSPYWCALVMATTMIALLMRRVDWAFYLSFGFMNLSGLWNDQAARRKTVLSLVVGLALCLSFAAHAVWLVIPLLMLDCLLSWCIRPALLEELRRRPTRTEYVAHQREQCASGGG